MNQPFPPQTAAAPLTFLPPPSPRWAGGLRRWSASAVCVFLGSFYFQRFVLDFARAGAVMVFVVFLLLAATLVHVRHTAAQMVVRSALWSSWMLGGFLSLLGDAKEQGLGLWLILPATGALLLLGTVERFDGERPRTRGLRAWISIVAVLAVADTVSLLMWGLLNFDKGRSPGVLLLAAFMVPALYGLYRMRGWALRWNVAANLAVPAVLLTSTFNVDRALILVLVCTALLQLAVAAAMKVYLRLSWRRRLAMARVRNTLGLTVCLLVPAFILGARIMNDAGSVWWGLLGKSG